MEAEQPHLQQPQVVPTRFGNRRYNHDLCTNQGPNLSFFCAGIKQKQLECGVRVCVCVGGGGGAVVNAGWSGAPQDRKEIRAEREKEGVRTSEKR